MSAKCAPTNATSGRRALVLGGGGNTGIAWETGVLDGLAGGGVDLDSPDVIVGTSAGAIVGAYLALGHSPRDLATHLLERVLTRARMSLRAVAVLGLAQLPRDREAAIRALARLTGGWPALAEDAWIHAISADLLGRPWPANLIVTTVSGATGRPALLRRADGIDLGLAVAASCSVPGIFPPVHLGGVPHLDGGLRSPANADLAEGCERVLAITPLTRARDRRRRPAVQLDALGPGTAWAHLWPDRASRRAMGLDPLDSGNNVPARDAGRRQAREALAAVRAIWG